MKPEIKKVIKQTLDDNCSELDEEDDNNLYSKLRNVRRRLSKSRSDGFDSWIRVCWAIGNIGFSGRSRASARSCPGTRADPQRDKQGNGVTVATPGGDVTRGRDHRPPALPPGPYPTVFHSSESAGVLGPLWGCVRAHRP